MATTRVSTVVEVPSITTLRDLKARRELPQLCLAYRHYQEQKTAIEREQKAIMAEIAEHADRANVDKVDGGEGDSAWRLMKQYRTTSTLSKERLLEKGVKMTVIEACTVVAVSEFYKVTGRKEEE